MQQTPLSRTRLDPPTSEAESRAPSGARPPSSKKHVFAKQIQANHQRGHLPAEAIILKSFKNFSPRSVRQAPTKRKFLEAIKRACPQAGLNQAESWPLIADS